jgi:hypothetical protein
MRNVSDQILAQELVRQTVKRINEMTVGEFDDMCRGYGFTPVRKWGVSDDDLLGKHDAVHV